MLKRSSNNNLKLNLNLTIYNYIKNGLGPAQIAKKLKMKKPTIQYYINNLRANGLIEKLGYGVWIAKKDWQEVQKTTQVTPASHNLNLFKPDNVRGHAFMFKVKLPTLNNWVSREEIFKKKNIKFGKLNIAGGGQKLTFRGRKVWLTNKSIIIYEKSSYLAPTGEISQKHAINELKKLLVGLESLLKASFRIGGKYYFQVSRQHYALVKNALAQQYNDQGEKLSVYSSNGLWFVIDNSYNLDEAEALHAKTALTDIKKVQNFFNGIKKYEDFTPEFVVNSIAGVSQNQALYSKNIETHIKAIQDLGEGVEKNNLIMEEILNLVKKRKVD